MNLAALRQRVAEAKGPDRDLDARIWCALVEPQEYEPERAWINERTGRMYHRSWNVSAYTASVDAALSLIEAKLPGANVDLFRRAEGWTTFVYLGGKVQAVLDREANAPTPALALIAALLSALEQKDQGND